MDWKELKRRMLLLMLGVGYGVDAEKGLTITKDTCTFYHPDREKPIVVPVQNINYAGREFVFNKDTFIEDGALVINTQHTIAFINRKTTREWLKLVKKDIRKEGDLWIVPEKSLPLKGCLFSNPDEGSLDYANDK